ncbi:hypothetical protein AMTR_s00064p00199680 [Amborella trichopoda]|uniref:Uncharacterized protein n=1 Tax=Amborella trichopoda TaxID=13333 RepID=U5DHA1_AMBTC|nr:hypothetical protein AMTR_s00064p00199680 [Amborella trichopoda]
MTLVASDIVQRFNGNAVLGLDRLPIAREFCKGTGLGGAKVGVGGGQADEKMRGSWAERLFEIFDVRAAK